MTKRREKQSESLEIRLGHSAKQAFMEACREKGLTASEVVRDFVEAYPETRARSGWSFPEVKLPEPAMQMSAVVLLSAVLGTSAILPTAATADRTDAEADFADLDRNGDGYFVLADLYAIAGMTPEGELSEAMRADVMESVQSAVDDLGMFAQQGVLHPEFVERTILQAQEAASSSVQRVFEDLDDDGDARVSRQEFFAHREFYQQNGPGLTGPDPDVDPDIDFDIEPDL